MYHNNSNFNGFALDGEIKLGPITQYLSKDLENMSKERLDLR